MLHSLRLGEAKGSLDDIPEDMKDTFGKSTRPLTKKKRISSGVIDTLNPINATRKRLMHQLGQEQKVVDDCDIEVQHAQLDTLHQRDIRAIEYRMWNMSTDTCMASVIRKFIFTFCFISFYKHVLYSDN